MKQLSVGLLLGIVILVAGCGAKQVPPQVVTIREPFEVKVPVPVRRPFPPELLVKLTPPLPIFVAPSDPEASSALTAKDERLLRGLVEDLLGRINACIVWGTAPD